MKRAKNTRRLASTTQQTVTADNTAGTESPVDADDLLGEAGAKSDDGAGSEDEHVPPEESSADEADDRGGERSPVDDEAVLSLEELGVALDKDSEKPSWTNRLTEASSSRKERLQSPDDSVVEKPAAAPVASPSVGSSQRPTSIDTTSIAVSGKIALQEEVCADVFCAACRR